MPTDESYSTFYTDDKKFCFQTSFSHSSPRISVIVNPKKIFTSTFKSVNKICKRDPSLSMLTLPYFILRAYFKDPISKKYIDMLDESEWKFWFIHVTTQLKKLQTSPQWKQDGKPNRIQVTILMLCYNIFYRHMSKWELYEKSFQTLKEFFHALANCIDVLTPRLPHENFIEILSGICHTFKKPPRSTKWKVLEKSGLLAHFLRCSTMPLDDMGCTYSFYTELTGQFNFIEKEFKAGQPCGDMVRKILAGKEGHSTPDRKVLNFLRALSQLADKTQLDEPRCHFCKTTKSEQLLFCSQCRTTSYCSKECQRSDWKSHREYCQKPLDLRKDLNTLHKFVERFVIDHRDAILLEINEMGCKIEDLMLELDFAVDECGVAPALSDPPQFKIICDKTLHEYLPKYIDVVDDLILMRKNLGNLNESHLLCLGISNKGVVTTAMPLRSS